MKICYIPHTFGKNVDSKLASRRGWLTAGVASSIAWPSSDVCVQYAGDEYFLRGSEREGKASPPGITIACNGEGHVDESIAKIYRFTSILSWFNCGYVDVSGYVWGSHPILYGDLFVYSTMGIAGAKSFSCNHMPIIENENMRKALAFWREGKRLEKVHDSYSFLSFYKVIESQFADAKKKGRWIDANIVKLTNRAAKRAQELRDQGTDVALHLYQNGRCAVAHATLEGEIIDPDIPADKRRLSADLVIIEELAQIYIRNELGVPDSRSLFKSRNRLSPWDSLLPIGILEALRRGEDVSDMSALAAKVVTVGLWPDGPIPGLERMVVHIGNVGKGLVESILVNERNTIQLVFVLDYKGGLVHVNLEKCGLSSMKNSPDENDVRAYATFYYKVFSNGIAELMCEGLEPIDCEIVIPVNMFMATSAEQAIAETVEEFKKNNL